MDRGLGEWPLVGRDEELTVLATALDRPDRGCVVIAGEPGVGKSRLGRLLLDRAAARGARTERITGTRSAAAMPLAAVLNLLPDDEPDGGDQLALFRQIRRNLTTGGGRPFLLVDDAHLLDPSSAALIHHLVLNRTVDAAVVVRSNEPVPDAVTALWRDELGERVELQPLSPDDLGTLVGAVVGGRLDDGSTSRLWKATGGNPLFLREVVREAVGRGQLDEHDGVWTWTGQVAIGSRLRELVAAPLAALDPAERAVVDLLAVGEELPLGLLEHECDLVAVAGARRRGLVVTEGAGARLHHPVLGELVRADLTAPERARLSGRLAAATAATGAPIDRLRLATWHLDAGLATDAPLFTDAAIQALHRFDPVLAEQLARAALDAGDDRRSRLVLGQALVDQQRFAEAEVVGLALADAAAEAGDDHDLVAAATLLTDVLYWGQARPDDATAALLRLDADHWTEPTRLHLAALRGAIAANSGAVDAALELTLPWAADPGVAVEARLHAVTAVGLALSMAGRPGEALALCDGLLGPAAARARDAPRDMGRVLGQRVLALVLGARLDDAESVMAAVHPMAVADGDDEMQAGAALVLGQIAIERGNVAAADAHLREAAMLLRRHDPQRYLPWCLALLARAAGEAGDPHAAAAAATEAEDLAVDSPVQVYAAQVSLGRAWALAAGGELSRARTVALDAAEHAIAGGARLLGMIALDMALRFDAPPGPVAARLRDLADSCDTPLLTAFIAHAEALAADDGVALDAAADQLESVGMLLRAALAAGAAGEAHTRAGRRSSATRSRGRAARLLAACPGVAGAAGAASAASSHDTADTPPPGLTRREREIAGLAATGLSNAEIAERLGVGVRTVEGHLLRASTKLGVRRRADLARALKPVRNA